MKRLFMPLIMLFACLSLLPLASADSFIAEGCDDVTAFDYAGQTECALHSEILAKNKVMFDENDKLMGELKEATKQKLDIDNEKKNKIYTFVLILSSTIFLLIITYTGYMYISSATYPEKREMAKIKLKNLVFIAIAIIAISPILAYVNDVSEMTTSYFYGRYFNEGEFKVQEFNVGSEGS